MYGVRVEEFSVVCNRILISSYL